MERHICTAALLLLAIVGVMAVDKLVLKAGVTGDQALEDGQEFSFDSGSSPVCKRVVFATDKVKFEKFATDVTAGDASKYLSTDEGFICDKKWRDEARKTVESVVGAGSGKVAKDMADFNTNGFGKKFGEVQFFLVAKGSCEQNYGTVFNVWAAGASRGSLLLVWAVCLLMAVMHFREDSYE